MKNTTLSTKMLCAVLVAFLALTSCTKDTSEDNLYDHQAGKDFSPLEKPVVDRRDIRVKPDRSVDEIPIIQRSNLN